MTSLILLILRNLSVVLVVYTIAFRALRLSRTNLVYLCLLPVVIFCPDLKALLFILTLSLSFIFSMKVSRKFLMVFFLGLGVALFTYRPSLDFQSSLGIVNSINSQRGEDLMVNLPPILAKSLHNKFSLIFSVIDNFEKTFSPVRIFASAGYPNINSDYPLGFLFPWDIICVIVLIGMYRYNRRQLPVIMSLLLMLTIPLLSSQASLRFIISGAFAYILGLLVAVNIKIPEKLIIPWIVLIVLFDILNIFTVIPFIVPIS